MGLNPRSQWFVVMARILGLLAVLALAVPAAEARFKMKWKSTPTSSSIPSASKSSPPSAKLDAANEHATVGTARGFSTNLLSGQCQDRGFFRRIWDGLFGRKHEPAPAPQAPLPPGLQAVAASPANPPAPKVVVPVVPARPVAAPVPSGVQPTGREHEKESQWKAALEGSSLRSSSKAGSEARTRAVLAQPAAATSQPRPARQPVGYTLHLTNGRAISVADYEQKGTQVVISQMQGSYSLHKSLIARIEPRGL